MKDRNVRGGILATIAALMGIIGHLALFLQWYRIGMGAESAEPGCEILLKYIHPLLAEPACPNGAIEVSGPVNARVLNTNKCTGCRQCQADCPWDMTVFDEQLKKASKCHLCNGEPECVKACPNAAIRYVAWEDRSKDIPTKWVVPAYISTPPNVAATCGTCHK